MLQVEPTSVCNLSCPLCPVGRKELGRPYRHMSFAAFKNLIDDMERYLLFLVMWDWGEPLTNPELPAMVRYASERDIRTVTSTNAHFLEKEDYVAELLTAGLSTLIVAVDTVDPEHYKHYRQKGDLQRVMSGLEKTVALKKRLGARTLINLRMVVMRQNEHEIAKTRQYARKAGVDFFTAKTLNPTCGAVALDSSLVPLNPRYRRYAYKKGTWKRLRHNAVCRRVWTMANILSNGDVVPCCYDYSAELKVGSILQTPFTQIWNSYPYRELRRRIYNDLRSIRRCYDCDINFKSSKSGWFVESKRLIRGARPAEPKEPFTAVPWIFETLRHHLRKMPLLREAYHAIKEHRLREHQDQDG